MGVELELTTTFKGYGDVFVNGENIWLLEVELLR